MNDDPNQPAAAPVSAHEVAGQAFRRQTVLLLGIGAAVGLALGIGLTVGVYATYTLFTQTLPSTRDSMLVFNELNELRQQINQLNAENALKEKEKAEPVRQALSAVASTIRVPEGLTPSVILATKKQAEAPDRGRVMKPQDPFADIDAEVKKLEQTQKVLNTLLDVLMPKAKEPAKER
jgi:hypothetical protein